jgi:hypothetical protein
MALTYELLLDLYRGRSTAVEQITDAAQLEAMAVETPIGRLLREVDEADAPRHVVLTGSAGDGKTFAALTARTKTFRIIADASARRAGVDLPPVDDLAEQVASALGAGRLLLAINRGQLERLYERTAAKGGAVGAFVTQVRERAALRATWGPGTGEVAVVDLGHLDRVTTATSIVKKVSEMSDPAHLAAPTREAFRLARAALKSPRALEWVLSVVRAATATGANVTMRQLWSFVSYLATGARGPDDQRALSLNDAVGARLFDGLAEGALFEVARERCDPALIPNAHLAREILDGTLLTKLRAAEIAPLLAGDTKLSGRTAVRVAIVHGVGVNLHPSQPQDDFAEVIGRLAALPAGPQPLGTYPREILKGIYRTLGLWHSAAVLPGWQTLCFDSSRVDGAAAVADSFLNPKAFKLALPRPPPEVAQYLLPSWRPPFLWLAAPGQPWLRLTPRVFVALLAGPAANARNLEPGELFALDSWLRRVGTVGGAGVTLDGDPAKLRISRRSSGSCVVLEEGLHSKTTVSIE